jgi:hypothetical protein
MATGGSVSLSLDADIPPAGLIALIRDSS